MTRRVLPRELLTGALALLGAITAGGCVDLGNLAGDDGGEVCRPDQHVAAGRCVDGPLQQPARPDGSCKEGLQDNDKDSVCEATCSTAKLACALHSKCVDASGKASCACAVGYEREGEACVWRGGVRDPGFQNKPSAWEITSGTIDPAAAAPVDLGRARFTSDAVCSGAAVVRQSFKMPAFADSEPFAITIQGQQALGVDSGGVTLFVSDGFGGDTSFDATPKSRVCLGENAYGGDVKLVLRARGVDCTTTSTVDIDRVDIVPAPDCPAPSRVVNGDFEGTGGWVASGAGAEVATAVGTSGGRGGRVSTTNLCQSPSLTGTMSAPSTSLPNVALSFSYKGTTGKQMHVEAGPGATLGVVTGTATFQEAKLCVPQWAKGTASSLRFRLLDPGGLCADSNVRDFVFDDVKFVSDPKCALSAAVVDGGFENATNEVSSWLLEHDTPFSTEARIIRNAADTAHSGAAYVRLATGQPCHYGRAKQTITVPSPGAAAGPAVKLWYRLPVRTKALFETSPGGALEVSATWKQKVVCLDPKDAGRPIPFEIRADGGGGTCADFYGTERLDLDDVEVTTDATCPVK